MNEDTINAYIKLKKHLESLGHTNFSFILNDDLTFIVESGAIEEDLSLAIASGVADPSYQELRMKEYPSISDQLDMIYWDKVNGTTTWKDAIQAVKDAYPKE